MGRKCHSSLGIFHRFCRPCSIPVDPATTMNRKRAIYLSSQRIMSYLFNHFKRISSGLLPLAFPAYKGAFGGFDTPWRVHSW